MVDESHRLTPAESRRLWRRLAVAQWGHVVVVGVVVVAMFAASAAADQFGLFVWFLFAVPLFGAFFVFHFRAVRCPRCRQNVFGPRPADPEAPYAGDPSWSRGLPERCGFCGVRLTTAT